MHDALDPGRGPRAGALEDTIRTGDLEALARLLDSSPGLATARLEQKVSQVAEALAVRLSLGLIRERPTVRSLDAAKALAIHLGITQGIDNGAHQLLWARRIT